MMMARRRTHGEELIMQAHMAFDSCGEDKKSGPLHYIIAGSAGVRAMAWAESVYWWHSTAARWTWLMEPVGSDGQVKAHYFRVCSKVLYCMWTTPQLRQGAVVVLVLFPIRCSLLLFPRAQLISGDNIP
jgi:hypothetical protein